jgi:hypothetical protein
VGGAEGERRIGALSAVLDRFITRIWIPGTHRVWIGRPDPVNIAPDQLADHPRDLGVPDLEIGTVDRVVERPPDRGIEPASAWAYRRL